MLHAITLLPLCRKPGATWPSLLSEVVHSSEIAQAVGSCKFKIIACTSSDEVIGHFERQEAADEGNRFILISDAITETLGDSPRQSAKPLEWVKEHVAPSSWGVSVAVESDSQRIVDIDRVIAPDSPRLEWIQVLGQMSAKLLYLSRPSQRPSNSDITCRTITGQGEFHAYFRLRHSVYSVMGYLEREVETCTSQLEIDSSDPHAMHFGAFAAGRTGEMLVGTARMVTNRPAVPALVKSLAQMSAGDPIIRKRLANELPLQLPVFQSQRMNPVLTEILSQDVVCGELSRVIVGSQHRGSGISTLLVDHTIERARHQGVQRMFLECLPCHVPFYERMGFRVVPGLTGQVLGVQRTMGVMELDFSARPKRPR